MSSTGALAAADLRIICGPTGAGKSAIALRLAERYGALIISADSRQIYRGFDIGTAKPTAADRARVPHRGVDIVDPGERFSAGSWAQRAREWIAEAHAAGRTPLIVGGTGFYLRALVEPLFDAPSLDPARRAALDDVLRAMPVDELRRWTEALDPARARLGRAQLLRAVETALLSGSRLSDLHRVRARSPEFTARYLLVDPGGQEALARRIADRADAMFAAGWEEEVRALMRHLPPDAPAWNACGYLTIRGLVEGKAARELVRERVIIDTRQYAKRQRTWFRHQLPAARVTGIDPRSRDAMARVDAWWHDSAEERSA